ncbi:MAG: CPBP family intramembrane metalloprotease [Flavisolibacter sp.]|nr:CPBP family intramembrane metalloprotease [Flavisolibacter sp.]
MQSYLKTKPVWLQLLLFLGMACATFMALLMVGTQVLTSITGVNFFDIKDVSRWSNTPDMITFIRGMLVLQFLGMFVVPSLLFARLSDPDLKLYLGLQLPAGKIYWLLGIAALLAAIPLVEYTGLLNREINFGRWQGLAQSMEDEAAKQIAFMLGRTTPVDLVLNIIFIAAFAGIGEELFFRGVLQRLFIKGTRNAWAGIVITAFLFSFFHFQFFGFLPRFLLGILLGALYWYSGSLWTAIVAHFVYDALFIVLAYFQPQLMQNPEASLFEKQHLTVVTLVSAALVGLIIWAMKKASVTVHETDYDNPLPPSSEM